MALLRLAALGTLAYLGYKLFEKSRDERHAAFAPNQTGTVRDAGPESMADPCVHEWTAADEASDESFPASDPPGKY